MGRGEIRIDLAGTLEQPFRFGQAIAFHVVE
jgi:hypothetical protein